MDEKRKKFVDLANLRVNKAIKSIRLIGNLSNRSNYFYNKEDVNQIINALNSELKNCRQKFDSVNEDDTRTFSLK